MKSKSYLIVISLFAIGCSPNEAPPPPPQEEWFVGLPNGMPIECGYAVRASVLELIDILPVDTPITFFLADNQALLGSMTVPTGAVAYRRHVAKKKLAKAFERLAPELTGGSQLVDLIAISATVRKHRKSNLKPIVVVVGSPLIVDREQGKGFTSNNLPCDGCVTDSESSYGQMETFPANTELRFFTTKQDYGNGPNHRSQVEHFLRYLIQEKGGTLLCISADAEVVFSSTQSQWDNDVTAEDDCRGVKQVSDDEARTILYDTDGETEIVEIQPDLAVRIQAPDPEHLKRLQPRVFFHIDTSGSMAEDPDGNTQTEVFEALIDDVCEKLGTMPMTHFAICGFGGTEDLRPRLSKFPTSMLSGLYWAEATRENRNAAIQFVKRLDASGGTPTLAALLAAGELEGPMTCILYSDGVPTLGDGGQIAVLQYAQELAKRNITVNTVGVGALSASNEDFDFTGGEFLARLAQATSGDYFVLDNEL